MLLGGQPLPVGLGAIRLRCSRIDQPNNPRQIVLLRVNASRNRWRDSERSVPSAQVAIQEEQGNHSRVLLQGACQVAPFDV